MRRLVTAGLIAALTLCAVAAAHAGPPTDQLKTAIDRILVILQDPTLKQPGKADERRQKIRAVANEVFD
jgi:phospholipid transport system substrate-binding protein